MIGEELVRRAQELTEAREPFVTATVVRVQHPASVEPGSTALVLADGTIEGFVGGVCAEQSVKAYSLLALKSEEPVLLRILPDPVEGEGRDERELTPEEVLAAGEELPTEEEGAVTVKNPCLSGGAIEVFLEPSPPSPRVLLVGNTPTVAPRSGSARSWDSKWSGPTAAIQSRRRATWRLSSPPTGATSCTRCAARSRWACPTSDWSPARGGAPP